MRDEHPQRSQDWKEEEKVEEEASGNEVNMPGTGSLGEVAVDAF